MLLENETYIQLKKASELFPGRPSVATLWRWASRRGYRGIVLADISHLGFA